MLNEIPSAHREQPELSNSQLLKLMLVCFYDYLILTCTNRFGIITAILSWYTFVRPYISQMSVETMHIYTICPHTNIAATCVSNGSDKARCQP